MGTQLSSYVVELSLFVGLVLFSAGVGFSALTQSDFGYEQGFVLCWTSPKLGWKTISGSFNLFFPISDFKFQLVICILVKHYIFNQILPDLSVV